MNMSYKFEDNIFYFDRPVISVTKTGKVSLTESVKRVLYPAIVASNSNREECVNCKTKRSGNNRLSIDHIDSKKPLESEKNHIINVAHYQLLCVSCNTKKQRSFEKIKDPKTINSYTPLKRSTMGVRKNVNGITHTHTQAQNNRTLDSNKLSIQLKRSFIKAVLEVIEEEIKLDKKDLINYALSLCFQRNIILSYASAVVYLEPFINTPKKYGGLFKMYDSQIVERLL